MGASALLIGLAVAGTGVEVYSQFETNEARQTALRQRMAQEKLAANNATLQRQRRLQEIISRQNAEVGARGFDPASASFKAIQSDTFDEFAQDQKAANLSLSFEEQAINNEMESSSEGAFLGAVGDILGTGMSMYKIYSAPAVKALTPGDFGLTGNLPQLPAPAETQKNSLLNYSSSGGVF